jgi:hypothetical protein
MPNVYAHDDQESMEPQCTFMEELCSKWTSIKQQSQQSTSVNECVNLDNFFESNQQCESAFINCQRNQWKFFQQLPSPL